MTVADSGRGAPTTDAASGRAPAPSAMDRIRLAAYELFSTNGVRAVGVDAVVERAGTAKMTLYRNFPSKDDLVLDFLERRERLWSDEWLRAGCRARAADPSGRLLAVFELFGEWFAEPDFEGCAFVTTMLEYSDHEHPIRRDAVTRLAGIRGFLCDLARDAGLGDPEHVAAQWHLLMKGAIIAAHEGDRSAAAKARELGVLLLRSHGLPAS